MDTVKRDTNNQKSCFECDKKGTHLFTCNGCGNSFCGEHVPKHREDLIHKFDRIVQEHDQIQEDLNEKSSLPHPFLDYIDKWENDSINKIKQTADLARQKVQELDRHRYDLLKTSLDQITEQIQSVRQLNDYSEIEIEKYTTDFKQFRTKLDTLLAIRAINDDKISPIYLIKIEQIGPITNLDDDDNDEHEQFNTDRFDKIITGPIILSDEDHLATCTGGFLASYGSVRSVGQYSNKIQRFRFCLKSKSRDPIFIGIVSSSEICIPRTYKSPSAYGWRDIDFTVIKGISNNKSTKKEEKFLQTGDEIQLIVDCENKRLRLFHKRTRIYDTLNIDLQACPLPWQLAVSMIGKNDQVRIF